MATLTQKLKSCSEPQMINLNQTEFPHLQTTDLFRVMNHLPRCAVGGPWIAGGAVWRAVLNHPLDKCDIDMFFASKQQFDSTVLLMGGYPFVRNILQETKNKWNITYKIHANQGNFNKTINVQLINMSYYRNLDDLLNSFDFTACQFGWDGQNLVSNRTSVADLNDRKISLWKLGSPKSLFSHLIKYMDNGFTLSSDETKKLLNNILSTNPWNTKNNKDYNDQFETNNNEWHAAPYYADVAPQRNRVRVVDVDMGEPVTTNFTNWQCTQPAYTQNDRGWAATPTTNGMVDPAPETFAQPVPNNAFLTPTPTIQEIVGAQPMDLNATQPAAPTLPTPTDLQPPWEQMPRTIEDVERRMEEIIQRRDDTIERELTEIGATFQGTMTVGPGAFDGIFADRPRRNNIQNHYTHPLEQRAPRGPARFDEDRANPALREAFIQGFLNTPVRPNNEQENTQQERR